MKDDDLEIVIDDKDLPPDFDAPVEAKTEEKPVVETKDSKADDKPIVKNDDDPIASLKRQLDEARADAERERQERARVERERNEATTTAQRATHGAITSKIDTVDSAIALAKSEAEKAEREMAAAYEIADYAAAAKAQRLMTRAETQLAELERGKVELEHRRRHAETERREQPAPAVDKAEEFVNYLIANGTPKTQDYVRRNRDNLKSQRAVDKVQAVHSLAVADGIQADTPEYFAFIDKQMGWGDAPADREPLKPQAKSVAAPVSRDTAKANGDLSDRRVRLTSEEVAFAKELGISPTQYAKNKLRIASNGKDPHADGLRFTNDIR